MKKVMFLMCGLFLIWGCATKIAPKIEKELFFTQNADSFFKQTHAVSTDFIKAVFDGNEAEVKRCAGPTLSEKITPEVLQALAKDLSENYGSLREIVYLGDFNNPLFRTAMYKVVFEKKISDRIRVMEIPCQIGYTLVEGTPKVMMFNFASIL